MRILCAALVLGCASRERPVEQATPAVAPHYDEAIAKALRSFAVTRDAYAHRVLYTWTSDVGLARMKSEKRLLLPTEREGYFVEELDALSGTNDVAQLLAHDPNFASKRYAWTRPSATRVPLADRSYGDHLVEITLKPHAIVGRFDARDAVPFSFMTLDGEDVPVGAVLNDPSRLAAIYHESADPKTGVEFREFVLINESMIAEWSLGSERIARVLEGEVKMLRGAFDTQVYLASNAFDTPRHKPTPENLDALARSLEALPPDAPLTIVPAVTFSPNAPKPPAVPPLPPNFGVKVKIPRKYICD